MIRLACSRPRPERRAAGFTLLEALVALAVLGLLLAVLARGLALAHQASAVVDERAEEQQVAGLASALLRYDLGSAGYARPDLAESFEVPEPALLLERRPDDPFGDRLRVRYLEDRELDVPKLRDHGFSAGVDGRGDPQLYRREGSGSRQPMVAGLTSLRVVALADGNGWRSLRFQDPASGAAQDAANDPAASVTGLYPVVTGLRLELTFAWGQTVLLVADLPNAPALRVLDGAGP